MRQDFCLLSDDCPSLLFNGKFADLVALNTGDAFALRPVLDEEARARLDRLPWHGTDTALVVGGNGFVGAHVVARLSRDPRIRKVLATVRASDGRDPRERLDETLRKYKVTDLVPEKIEVLDATPVKSGFGLPAARYRELADDVDLVFGCATSNEADVTSETKLLCREVTRATGAEVYALDLFTGDGGHKVVNEVNHVPLFRGATAATGVSIGAAIAGYLEYVLAGDVKLTGAR